MKEQKAFEKNIFNKTHRTDSKMLSWSMTFWPSPNMANTCICKSSGEIALLEGLTVVYKSNIDLFFYVIGSSHENEVGSE